MLLVTQAYLYGQEPIEKYNNCFYQFEFQHANTQDSLPILYCVISLKELHNFHQLTLSYNDKQDTYLVGDLLKGGTTNYMTKGNRLYIKIAGLLKEPYVVITASNNKGQQYSIWQKNARGEIIDPAKERLRWKKNISRIDSIDSRRKLN